MVFKVLSYSHTSPLYWSPTSYSGPGLTARLERTYDLFSYRAALPVHRITQTQTTEASAEGGIAYRPRKAWFGEATALIGRGAGATPGTGTYNTEYRSAFLKIGYEF